MFSHCPGIFILSNDTQSMNASFPIFLIVEGNLSETIFGQQ